MSFILDALRKSEHERQRQASPGIADIRPAATYRSSLPKWALALGGLLAINAIVVIVLVFRSNSTPEAAPAASAPAPTTVAAAPAGATPTPAPVASVVSGTPVLPPAPAPRQEIPAVEPETGEPTDGEPPPLEAEPTLRPQAKSPAPIEAEPDESYASLPTMGTVTSQGAAIPDLHLDLHVYASRPADRFVFLNTRKYREGGKTPDGTTIERITPDGVVLNHHGVRFLLPRQ